MDSKEKARDEIRKLYIDFSNMFGHFKKLYEEGFGDGLSVFKMGHLRKKLHEKLDNLINRTEKGCDDHNRYILMKVYLMNSEAEELCFTNYTEIPSYYLKSRKCAEDALTLIMPLIELGNDKLYMFIHAYTCVCFNISYSYLNRNSGDDDSDETETSKMWCQKAYDVCESFLKLHKFEDAWDGRNVFEISDQDLSDTGKYYHSRRNLRMIFGVCALRLTKMNLLNPELCVKYGLPALHIMERSLKGSHINHHKEKIDMCTILDLIAKYLIYFGRYKQANHLLGIAMYYSVKTIRDSCPEDVKFTVKKLQGTISMSYALLGEFIVKLSLQHRQHSESRDRIEETMKKINAEVLVGTELMENGVELYQSDIPIKIIESVEEMKKVLKKSLLWFKRANTLIEKDDQVVKGLRETETNLNGYLKICENLILKQ